MSTTKAAAANLAGNDSVTDLEVDSQVVENDRVSRNTCMARPRLQPSQQAKIGKILLCQCDEVPLSANCISGPLVRHFSVCALCGSVIIFAKERECQYSWTAVSCLLISGPG